MKNVVRFCDLFYSVHFLPIALYTDEKQIAVYTSLEKQINVFYTALPYLMKTEQNPAVFTSEEAGVYGKVHIAESNDSIVIGPVFSGEVSEEAVYGFMRINAIPVEYKNDITTFLGALPKYTYNQFLNLLSFLHFSINGDSISVLEHFHYMNPKDDSAMAAKHTLKSVHAKEIQDVHGTYQYETMMLDFVRRGETKKLNIFLMESLKIRQFQEGTLAENPLRQAKNLLIGLVTMVGKVGAIGGGMDVEDTYQLIDLYIQECEKAQSVEVIKTLQYNLLLDFTERVALNQVPPNTSKEVFSCVQFIKNHTIDHIGITDVAEYIGRSRAYITKKFREEIGMTIGYFIMYSKLNDARSLLRYSDYSIVVISSLLCFSSQPYFQNVFKKEYGMTPTEFRHRAVYENTAEI